MTSSPPKSKLSWSRLIGLTIFAFGLGVSINVLEPALLGHQMLRFAPSWKNAALGAATFLGLLVAVVTQPLIGALSDRTRTRFGRRTPYLILGALVVAVSYLLLAYAPSLIILILALLIFQSATNTVQGPWQALIPDQVPGAQRGRAAGLKSTFEILGFVVGRQAGGALLAAEQPALAAVFAVGAYVITLAITMLTSTRRAPTSRRSSSLSLRQVFSVPWRERPNFALWFLNRLLFWGSLIAVNTFVLFYVVDAVGFDQAAAQRLVGRLGAVLGLGVLLTALPAGWLADRIGRRKLIAGAGALAAFGILVLLVLRSAAGVTLAGVLIGLATGTFLSGSWALATDLVPTVEAARYMGIANVASAGGSAAARGLGALMVDPLNQALGSDTIGYVLLFSLAVASLLLSSFLILRLDEDAVAEEAAAAPLGRS